MSDFTTALRARFDDLLGEARPHRGAVGWSKEKEAESREWMKKYYADSVGGSVEKDYKAGNVKTIHVDTPGHGAEHGKLKPDEKMVFGKVRKIGGAKKQPLSKILKKVNDKNAPPGGWSDADKVKESTEVSNFDAMVGLDEGSRGEARTNRITKAMNKKFDRGFAKGREGGREERRTAVATSDAASKKLHARRGERAKTIGAKGWHTTGPETKAMFAKGRKLKPGEKMVFGKVVKTESRFDQVAGLAESDDAKARFLQTAAEALDAKAKAAESRPKFDQVAGL